MTRTRVDGYSRSILQSRGKLLARTFALLVALAITAQLFHAAIARELAGGAAPDFALKSLSGTNFRLSEYRSEVVAVAFWASWCGQCRGDLAVLEKLQQQLGGEGLRVLGVSFDKDAAAARDAAGRVSFPLLLDAEGETGRLYDVRDLPLVVLVDRDGKIRASYGGGRTEEALVKDIRTLLRE